MLRTKFSTEHHFTISLFGCQYHGLTPSPSKLALITSFETLLESGAIFVEELEQNDLPSKIWMSYWASPQTFATWWTSAPVSSFWASLPLSDAGFWRETISLPATRAMYETNQPSPSGFGRVGEPIPLTAKTGYWGAYRSRMTPSSPDDKFASTLETVPSPRPFSEKIRPGRVRMTRFPENLCFVVEGQDYAAMGERERQHWDGHFKPLTEQWVTNVVTGGKEKGMVSARACHAFEGDKVKHPGATTNGNAEVNGKLSIFPGLDYIRQAQLLFWLDLSRMEHMGRHDKTHVKLRRDFLADYGAGGVMEGGDLLLWVDLGVLKSEEIDAEYVGCYDATGFMAYDDHPSFRSETVKEGPALPAFFDEPIASRPMEW